MPKDWSAHRQNLGRNGVESMPELVKVSVTPQGTADVSIGDLHIKTFTGTLAHQAACDFAQAIKNELASHSVARERRDSGPRLSDIERTVNNVVGNTTGDADEQTKGSDSISPKRSRYW